MYDIIFLILIFGGHFMKTVKRVLAAIMCVVLMLGIAPLNGFVGLKLPDFSTLFSVKAKADDYSGSLGNGLTWNLSNKGVLTISGNGSMHFNDYSSVPWNNYRQDIKKVIVEDGVSNIYSYSFSDCTNLKSIVLGNTIDTISENAFDNCGFYNNEDNWTDSALYISNYLIAINKTISGFFSIRNDTVLVAEGAFRDCISLTGVSIPKSIVKISRWMFMGCSNLRSVSIENGIKEIGYLAFGQCSSLESISMPNSITKIDSYAFDQCSNLSEIQMSNSIEEVGEDIVRETAFYENDINWDGKDLYLGKCYIAGRYYWQSDENYESCSIKSGTKIIAGRAFSNCSHLNKIEIPSSVTYIGGYAFSYCRNLTSINLPNSIKCLGYDAFRECSSLKEISIPTGIDEIPSSVFENCSSLESITIPEGIKQMGATVFSGCSNLKTVYYNAVDCSFGASPWLWYTPSVEKFIIGPNVKHLRRSCIAFYYGNDNMLEELVIPSGVVSMDMSSVVSKNLKKVSIPLTLTETLL